MVRVRDKVEIGAQRREIGEVRVRDKVTEGG